VSDPTYPAAIQLNNDRVLPLYSGPEVVIRIGSVNNEYKLPKALLCTQVPYFAAMFEEAHFIESAKLSTTLEEIDRFVSSQSFEMLLQWVCQNRLVFGDLPPAEATTASIEFARLANMCNIAGMDSLMAKQIKQIILATKLPEDDLFETPLDKNTYHLTFEHINSGS
jgi:hypothetical protein